MTEAFLAPYLAARSGVGVQLGELRQRSDLAAARAHLNSLAPLIEAKLADMARVIELRRAQDMPAVIAAERDGQGKRLMDTIRAEIGSLAQIEESAQARHQAEFLSNMRLLSTIIIIATLITVLLALAFAYLVVRETRHRLKAAVHAETQHLLAVQQDVARKLQQTNRTLQVNENRLAVTLHSIGDGVIATDAEGRVTLLNPLAERLTGWKQEEAPVTRWTKSSASSARRHANPRPIRSGKPWPGAPYGA